MKKISFNFDGVFFENSYNNKNDRYIKLTNLSGKSVEIRIHFYYSSVFFPFAEYKSKIENGIWILPNKLHVNSCSFIMLYIDDRKPIHINLLRNQKQKNPSDKIICVGLNKTGTTSLCKTLELLNLNCWGGSEPIFNLGFSLVTYSNNSIGTVTDLIEKTDVDFFQDIPFSCPGMSEKIIKQFPQSKYILTTRNSSEQWVNSVKKFWKEFFPNGKFDYTAAFDNRHFMYDRGLTHYPTYLLNMFETWELDKYEGSLDEQLAMVYNNHNESVRKTLELFGCDWIEINVEKKGEFKRLTDWLKMENEREDFLWENKTI